MVCTSKDEFRDDGAGVWEGSLQPSRILWCFVLKGQLRITNKHDSSSPDLEDTPD